MLKSAPRLFLLLLGLSVYLFSPVKVRGQYRIDAWTTENGLPQNSVNDLVQTRDGYLWLATNDGLVRFDGVRFKVFNKANSAGLANNRITEVHEDESGRLWVSGEDGSLLFYEHGRFTVVIKPGDALSQPRGFFNDDGAGSILLWIDPGKKHYQFKEGKLTPFEIAGRPSGAGIAYRDREGGLWFIEGYNFHHLKDGRRQSFNIEGGISRRIYQDRFGNIWLLVDVHGREIYRIKNNQLQKFETSANRFWSVTEDKAGNLWLSSFDNGLVRLDAAKVNSDDLKPEDFQHFTTENGLLTNSCGIIIADREGGVWVGSVKGLNRLLPQTIRVFSKKDGLEADNVYPVLEDRRGTIWLGAWQQSLIKYEAGVFSTFLKSLNYYHSLFEDRDGVLWMGNLDHVYYMEKGKPVQFTAQAGFEPETTFNVISEDRDGNMWFGSNKGLGRYRDGRATVFTTQNGLPDNVIVAFLQTRDGRIWVGTRGGIASLENEKITAYTEQHGLASNFTRSLYEDADGALWIGSYDGGLTRLKDGRFTRFSTKDGLHSDGVFCILEDAHGWFWMNSNQGIFRVRRQELNDFAEGRTKFLTSIPYGTQDGLLNIEGNGGRQPAGIKARDGQLWFPMAQGVAVVDPARVPTNPLPPPVLIEEISIDRNAVSNDLFQSATGAQQSIITLSPQQNNIEIQYTGLSFINSEQVTFKYKLEGLEPDWIEAGKRRTAYYSYLPPGDYTFRVIAANRDGVWNVQGATIRIRVNPAYYQTAWFWVLCALGFFGVLTLIYRYRLGQLREINEAKTAFAQQLIASQEQERKRIAAELHDSLGQSLLVIKNRALIGLMANNNASEGFNQISEASSQAIEEVRHIAYNLRPYHLDRLGLTESLEAMCDKVAETTPIRFECDFAPLDGVFTKDEEMTVYRIVQESVNNIIKHSQATVATIEIRRDSAGVVVKIRDDGRGFEARENQADGQRGGFGLIGQAERIRMLKGSFHIESAAGKGTNVIVRIPLPEKERARG